MKDFLKKNWVLIVLILLIILNSIWLIFKGLPYQHDIDFHYSRMVSLANTIKNGDFLALIHDAYHGYGYALGIFYGNFFFYIPALLCIIGIPKIISFKILYILINIGTVIITYFSLKGITKDKKISVITTVLYCLSEYRLFDIFVRGAFGEMLSFMFIPLVILGLYKIIYDDYTKWYLFSIGFVLLLLSHLITTILTAFFCVVIILLNSKRFINEKIRIKYLILSGFIGLLLGSFFLFPMLEQYFLSEIQIFTQGSVYLPVGLSLKDTLLPDWFFSCYLGISIIILIPIRLLFKKKNVDKKYHSLLSFGDMMLIIGIFSWICTTNIFPWSVLGKLLSFIQFPWRLLLFSTLFITISVAITLYILLKLKQDIKVKKIFTIIILTSVIINILYTVQFGIRKNHYNYLGENEIGNGEYLLNNTDVDDIENKKQQFITNNPDLKITDNKKGTSVVVNYDNNLKEDTYIEIPLFNYLGYEIEPNLKVSNGQNDTIKVYLVDEKGSFKIFYNGTLVQKISYSISILTFIGFSVYLIKINKKSKA